MYAHLRSLPPSPNPLENPVQPHTFPIPSIEGSVGAGGGGRGYGCSKELQYVHRSTSDQPQQNNRWQTICHMYIMYVSGLCLRVVGSRDGAVVRILASHQFGLGSIPGLSIISWVECVVGSRPCYEKFFSGCSGLPSPHKPTFPV